MTIRIVSILTCLLFVLPTAAQAEEFYGRVVAVRNGNEIKILIDDNQRVKVMLAEINSPEKAQPYGNRSKQALSTLVFNKAVTVRAQSTDRYGRIVGRVYADGVDVCAEMVRQGAAWVYRQYARDQGLLILEDEAQQKRVGLWDLPPAERVPPWQWRHPNRDATSQLQLDLLEPNKE